LYKDIAMLANGDTRSAINILETLVSVSDIDKDGNFKVDKETLMNLVQNRKLDYDKMGDSHYNIISALQKSIRGSDPDAAIHYLARLVKAGDLLTICRRLLVIAAEDIGLAYPNAIVITKACVDSAMQLGFPEARIPLAEATVMLAIAPKSNSAYSALDKAINDLDNKEIGQVPNVLRDSNTVGQMAGYKYPHAYDNNYVKQQYLPDELKNEKYYDYGMNKTEQGFKNYWERIK